MKKENEVFANNLQACLDVRGWDQPTFAKYMNVSVSSVSQWIRGLKMPRKPKLDLMAQLFNCQVSTLLEEPKPDDGKSEMYAAILQLATCMKPEDLFAEISRMRWIIKQYEEPPKNMPTYMCVNYQKGGD